MVTRVTPFATSTLEKAFRPVAAQIATLAANATGDPTTLVQLANGLQDRRFYGRYAGTPTRGYTGAAASMYGMILQNIAWRSLVAEFGHNLHNHSSKIALFMADLLSMPEVIRLACAEPRDAIRILAELTTFEAVVDDRGGDAIVVQLHWLAGTASRLFRRAAAVSLATATIDYTPDSQEDAQTVRDQVADILDRLAVEAADRFEDKSQYALDGLRTRIVTDLTARGAHLPPVLTRTIARPLPAAFVAYRLYADAARADDLVARNKPPHPAFLPITIEALAE